MFADLLEMPHLRFRFLTEEKAAELSAKMVPELAQLTQTPVDHYTLELIPTKLFLGGKSVTGDPFCEVLWFDRGQDVQDKAAELITRHLRTLHPEGDLVVCFQPLLRAAYYENGRHFGGN